MGCFFGLPIDFIAIIFKDFRALSRERESLSRQTPTRDLMTQRRSTSQLTVPRCRPLVCASAISSAVGSVRSAIPNSPLKPPFLVRGRAQKPPSQTTTCQPERRYPSVLQGVRRVLSSVGRHSLCSDRSRERHQRSTFLVELRAVVGRTGVDGDRVGSRVAICIGVHGHVRTNDRRSDEGAGRRRLDYRGRRHRAALSVRRSLESNFTARELSTHAMVRCTGVPYAVCWHLRFRRSTLAARTIRHRSNN